MWASINPGNIYFPEASVTVSRGSSGQSLETSCSAISPIFKIFSPDIRISVLKTVSEETAFPFFIKIYIYIPPADKDPDLICSDNIPLSVIDCHFYAVIKAEIRQLISKAREFRNTEISVFRLIVTDAKGFV